MALYKDSSGKIIDYKGGYASPAALGLTPVTASPSPSSSPFPAPVAKPPAPAPFSSLIQQPTAPAAMPVNAAAPANTDPDPERTAFLRSIGYTGAVNTTDPKTGKGVAHGWLIDNFGTDDWHAIKANPEAALQNAVNAQIAKQQSDPSFGSLAKPPYPTFKPFSLSDFMASPDYAFRQSEGEKGINRADAARGGFYSGAAGKELARFNSDLAAGEYGNAYNRHNNDFGIGYGQATQDSNTLFDRFSRIIGTGAGATNTGVDANQKNATAVGNIVGQVGNVNAAKTLDQGNTLSGGFSSILGNLGKSQYGNFGGQIYANNPWLNPDTNRFYYGR